MREPGAAGRGHETRDVNIRAILLFGGGLLAAAVVIHLALAGLLAVFARRPEAPAAARVPDAPPFRPPEPRLQTAPAEEMAELRRRQEALLGSYGWIDRRAGTVRMPVERAMDLVLERGLPTWK
jgi:hypothetical protein